VPDPHFDLGSLSAALLLLTPATVGEDIFQHSQHVVFRSVLRGFMAIKRKQLIKLGRRVAKPFAVDDLNHPACLEKSARLGDGSRGAYPNRLDGLTILRSADREGHPENIQQQ
jgi:hypothetical protein